MTYLEFYKKYSEAPLRQLPRFGLCSSFDDEGMPDNLLELFEPEQEDVQWLRVNGLRVIWWGAMGGALNDFNSFRQTVVLFCAAMNDEL